MKLRFNLQLNQVKTIGYAILVVVLVLVIQLGINNSFHDEYKMIEAFSDTKTNIDKSQVTVVANLGSKYLSSEDKQELINYLARLIGVDDNYTIETLKGENTNTVSAIRQGKNAKTQIEVISVEDEKGQAKPTNQYVYINLTLYEDIKSVMEFKNIIEDAVNTLEVKNVDSSVKMEGTFDGKLSMNQKNAIVDNLISKVQGKVVQDYREESGYTVYGYTSLIRNYITVEKERVNLNIAFSYDETKDRTILYLATPILNEDY